MRWYEAFMRRPRSLQSHSLSRWKGSTRFYGAPRAGQVSGGEAKTRVLDEQAATLY